MKHNILFLGPMLGRHANWVPNPAEELAPRLEERGYEYLLSSSVINRYLRLIDMLWAVIKNARKTDIISLQTYSGNSFIVEDIISWLTRLLHLRLIMVLHGGGMPEFSAAHPVWTQRVLKRAHCLITPSVFVQKEMSKYGLAVRVIPNGMDIKSYPFRLREGRLSHLIWLRAFHPIYQPEMAVMVIHHLVKDFPDISLQMIGPSYGSACLTQTKQLIARLGLESHIKIIGYVPKSELPAWLQSGDVLLNTTRYESFGIAVMEAAACGLPVVTTNVGELPLLWQDGQNALTVRVDNVSEMANAVRRILTDSSLAQQLSIAARQTAEEYDWANVLPQWEMLINEIIVKKRG